MKAGAFELAVHLFLQLTIILLTCRLMGRLLRRLGQTQVVSEMVAGVVLGPSLLGILFPSVQAWLFPKTLQLGGQSVIHPNMAILYALAQIGLVLYMFLIGLGMDTHILSKHSRDAVAVSVSGIAVPVVMGGIMGYLLASDSRLFAREVAGWEGGLFMASAMAITAFPMLARILTETGLSGTRMGTLAIGAAAFDDAAAWCLLACVIASTNNNPEIAVLAIAGGALYALIILTVGRRLFSWFGRVTARDNAVRIETIAVLMTLLMFCAWVTDKIGIYAIFGAFILGLSMPRGQFSDEVRRTVEPVTVSLLLPMFFVYSGLSTRLDVLVDPSLLSLAVLVILVAFICKGLGCGMAARAVGLNNRESATLGILMNARGLMELILVNIALERGLIHQNLFSILVLMAIVTTLSASPLFNLLNRGAPHAHTLRDLPTE